MSTLFIMDTNDDYCKPIDLTTKGKFFVGDCFMNPMFNHTPFFESKNATYNTHFQIESVHVYNGSNFTEKPISFSNIAEFYNFLLDFNEIILINKNSHDGLDLGFYKIFLNNKDYDLKKLPVSICWPTERIIFEKYIRYNPEFATKVKKMYFDYFFNKEMLNKFNLSINFSKLLVILQVKETVERFEHTPVYVLMNSLFRNDYAHPSEISDYVVELYQDEMLINYENTFNHLNRFIAKDEKFVKVGSNFLDFYKLYEATGLKLNSGIMINAYSKRVESIEQLKGIIEDLLSLKSNKLRDYV